ncbi:hypothetical protein [Beijerinckia indica]|uniref:Uncharacterized protein n=1 Tax=Beijerinckia indica subsp. indica (strain ATCC 9039 / DSM 1715 / NCIMB 8712) TaxID=395963 RepID=B2IDK8_BEII9|nr:hypothetical protein [Beijerinckia indica]ACB95444.1 conserved hypothetical protein [Beijerinckia indica subsp. indica ATCC 9039]
MPRIDGLRTIKRLMPTLACLGLLGSVTQSDAQSLLEAGPPPLRLQNRAGEADTSRSTLSLSAYYTATDMQPVHGVTWRIFEEAAQPNGTHKMLVESANAMPALPLPDGPYLIHAAYGLAGATKRVVLSGAPLSERIVLNAGALRIVGMLGETPISPAKLRISIYVPERGNSEAKLVLADGKAGDVIGLPEGNYHVVSTILDTVSGGAVNTTNSVVNADLKVQAGKITDATLRHSAAQMTLKLVNNPGGEALANTAFTILTPGGDVIREMIGAFPSLVLAAGEYVAIARHDNKTYQTTFKVVSTLDRDVEVLAK